MESEPLQLIVGGIFRTNKSDRLEWEKEEKEIIQMLQIIGTNYRKKVENESSKRKIPLRRMIDCCYKVTYDRQYYRENELLDVGKTKIICLLFPWIIRPQDNILFIKSSSIKLLPNSQLSKIKFV